MLNACCTFCSTCCIHCCITTTDNNNIFTDIEFSVICFEICKEFKCIDSFTLLQSQSSRLGSSYSQNYFCISFCFECIYIFYFCVQTNFYPHLLKKCCIFVDRCSRNSELWNHVTNNSAKSIVSLEYCNSHTSSSQEVSCCHTSRSTTDYCCFSFFYDCRSLKFTNKSFVSVLSCDQFHTTDMYRLFIEVTCTFTHTCMCTDCTCNEWKWVLLCDYFHCFFILTFFNKLQVCCDILMDRASFFTWSHEAVKQRHFFIDFSGWKRFYSLYVIWAYFSFFY